MTRTHAPVYLDCAATAPPDPRVIELMLRHLSEDYGNAGSYTHVYGAAARRAVERARDQIAAAVTARRSEIFFTSGATESNNLAILGTAGGAGSVSHIVTTAIEHPAVLEPVRVLEKRGCEVARVAPTPGGWVRAADVLAAVRDDTRLVSVMHINNETGVEQPIVEIAAGLQNSSTLFHVDASQGFGKIMEPLQLPRIDLLSLSAHKMGGPQGIGALVVRRRVRAAINPVTFGGGQEGGIRPGTLPVHLIAGFGLAAEIAVREAAERHSLALRFRSQILEGWKNIEFSINGDPDRMSPYVLNLSFPGLDSQQVTEAWSTLAAASNGSACTSRQIHCSHVLHAMGYDDARSASAVRLSWNHATRLPDLHAMARALKNLPRGGNGRRP
jgi:cysteine desulfurase